MPEIIQRRGRASSPSLGASALSCFVCAGRLAERVQPAAPGLHGQARRPDPPSDVPVTSAFSGVSLPNESAGCSEDVRSVEPDRNPLLDPATSPPYGKVAVRLSQVENMAQPVAELVTHPKNGWLQAIQCLPETSSLRNAMTMEYRHSVRE